MDQTYELGDWLDPWSVLYPPHAILDSYYGNLIVRRNKDPLSAAMYRSSEDMMKLLLKNGHPIHACHMRAAVESNWPEFAPDCVRMLLKYGGEIDPEPGEKPYLEIANSAKVAKVLLEHK